MTVNQILGTAALLDGKHVAGLDQTGLSQKGGPVVSHLRIGETAADIAGKVGVAEADVYLGFDLLVATAPPNLLRARPDLTIAVVSTTQVPTGAMVTSPDVAFPDPGGLVAAVNRVTRKDENVFVDALGLGESLFGDHLAANMILLGAAYQAGAIPMRGRGDRGSHRDQRRPGRDEHAGVPGGPAPGRRSGVGRTIERTRAGAVVRAQGARSRGAGSGGFRGGRGRARATARDAGPRADRLPGLRSTRGATSTSSGWSAEAERAAVPGETRLAEAVARYLYKLMAYKDEYEVARLHLRPEVLASIEAELGEAKVRYQLHPPLLRALGMQRKLSLGRWVEGLFRLLVTGRRLRGTPLDPFGYAKVRRTERSLVAEYRGMIERVARDLAPEGHERAVRIARLPDVVRGYEDVKLRNVERFREEARALGAEV